MRTLLLVYMVVYAVAWLGIYFTASFVVPPSERDPLWETVLDLVLLTVGFLGMVLFFKDVDHPHLRLAWKFIGPALLVTQGLMFIRHVRQRPRLIAEAGSELNDNEVGWLELGATALLLPSLAVNLAYGYL